MDANGTRRFLVVYRDNMTNEQGNNRAAAVARTAPTKQGTNSEPITLPADTCRSYRFALCVPTPVSQLASLATTVQMRRIVNGAF